MSKRTRWQVAICTVLVVIAGVIVAAQRLASPVSRVVVDAWDAAALPGEAVADFLDNPASIRHLDAHGEALRSGGHKSYSLDTLELRVPDRWIIAELAHGLPVIEANGVGLVIVHSMERERDSVLVDRLLEHVPTYTRVVHPSISRGTLARCLASQPATPTAEMVKAALGLRREVLDANSDPCEVLRQVLWVAEVRNALGREVVWLDRGSFQIVVGQESPESEQRSSGYAYVFDDEGSLKCGFRFIGKSESGDFPVDVARTLERLITPRVPAGR